MVKQITLTCAQCHKIFQRNLNQYKYQAKESGINYKPFCSLKCGGRYKSIPKLEVDCNWCHRKFLKLAKEIKKSNRDFCNHSCAMSYSNNNRIPASRKVPCKYCSVELLVESGSAKKVCDNCHKANNKKWRDLQIKKVKERNCKNCNTVIFGKKKQYCDSCRKLIMQESGRKVAANQPLRSKNEIHFFNLCLHHFKHNVSSNERFFKSPTGLWDADVILHDYKIAILWNGQWHYKQISKKQSLSQVQSRDKIKLQVIIDNGYIPYTIKDLGKENPKFVEQQFLLFISWIKSTNEYIMQNL